MTSCLPVLYKLTQPPSAKRLAEIIFVKIILWGDTPPPIGAMLRIFGYLNHHMKCQIICDTIFMEYQEEFDIDINWSKLYPDAV